MVSNIFYLFLYSVGKDKLELGGGRNRKDSRRMSQIEVMKMSLKKVERPEGSDSDDEKVRISSYVLQSYVSHLKFGYGFILVFIKMNNLFYSISTVWHTNYFHQSTLLFIR